MNGFKVICLKCGKETVYIPHGDICRKDNDYVSIYPSSYDGDISITCDCENNVDI